MTPHDREEWRSSLGTGRLLVQSCAHCHQLRFYPKPICPNCQDVNYELVAVSGRATIHSYTVIPDRDQRSRVVVLVELDEGLRAIGTLESYDEPCIGDRVQLAAPGTRPGAITFKKVE